MSSTPTAARSRTNAPDPAQPPLVLDDPAAQRWDDTADLVVVGFGGAGVCAALEGRERGLDVLVVDRFHGGGATAISGGVFYSGGGTHIQREAGVEDSVEEMVKYLAMETQGVVSDELLREFCEGSADTLRWLERYGVPFEASLCPFKTSYPLDKYYLYYSGNEGLYPFKEKAKPAPRGHRAKGKGLPGASFYAPLRESALRLGTRVMTETRVTRLLADRDGTIVGVEAQRIEGPWARLHQEMAARAIQIVPYNPGLATKLREQCFQLEKTRSKTIRLRATKGVVLAAGGFVYNREMIEQHAPGYRKGMPLGTPADRGRQRQRHPAGPERGRRRRPHGPRVGVALHQPARRVRPRLHRQQAGPALHQRDALRRRHRRGHGQRERPLQGLAHRHRRPLRPGLRGVHPHHGQGRL